MATSTQSDDPIEILENVPVKAGKYGKCHKCISESRKTGGDTDKGRYLYNIILHNKLTGTITAELRCRDCDCIQQNPLTTIVEHSYIARSAAETSCHQLSANNYSLQLNVNNLNNMCAMLQQRADKSVYDYTYLLNSYNAGQQINTEINARNKYLEENYAKAQTGINDMKSELAMLQASNINVVDRLKTEHTDICQKYIKTIADQNTMIANLNTTITNQNTTIEDMNKKIVDQDNNQKYIKTIADLNKKITDYDTKIVDLNTKIANLNKKISDQDKKVVDLNRDNMKYEEVNNRFKLQISEFEHINTDLKEQINTLVGAVRDLKPQNKSLEQSNKDLKTQIAALKKNKQAQNTGQAENAEQHAKIVQTYESELTILRGKLTEMIEEKKKMKQTQKDRCFEIIKNNEIILKATKQQADEFKTNIEKKYFEKELDIAKKYEQMLKECGVDETYKHTINTKYKAKLLLLTHFKQDRSFGNIQPYTSDTTRVTTGS